MAKKSNSTTKEKDVLLENVSAEWQKHLTPQRKKKTFYWKLSAWNTEY